MRGRKLLNDMTYLDDDLIEEAAKEKPIHGGTWKKWMGLAACLLCICSGMFYMTLHTEDATDTKSKDMKTEEDAKDSMSMPETTEEDSTVPLLGQILYSEELVRVMDLNKDKTMINGIVLILYNEQGTQIADENLLEKEYERLKQHGYHITRNHHTLQGNFTKKELKNFAITQNYGYRFEYKEEEK